MSLAPIGPELAQYNRRLIAERLGWPPEAAAACEAVDADHPGWSTYWAPRGWAYPNAGFYSARNGRRRSFHRIAGDPPGDEPLAYGPTAEDLIAAIETWPWRDRERFPAIDPLVDFDT